MLSYSLLLLAMHPECQHRVLEEVKLVLPDRDSKQVITYEDLSQLNETERVLKEAMRLFPAGHLLIREISSPLDLSTE